MPGKERRGVSRSSSSRQGRNSDRDDDSYYSERSRSRSRSRSREPNDRVSTSSKPRRSQLTKSNSNSKFKGRKDDRRSSEGGSSSGRHRSHEKSRSKDRSASRDKSSTRERSRSREKDKQRERSRSRESRRRDRSTSSERSRRLDRSRSRSQSKNPRDRSTSKERSEKRTRSRSRDRSKSSGDRSISRSRDHSSDSRDKSRDRSHSRERSSRERSKSRERSDSPGETEDPETGVRRRRKSSVERQKRTSYVKGASAQRKDKKVSEGRKSSVLGSLNAFLEEGKAAAPATPKDDRSVISSLSKIQRRKRTSMPTGSASVYGGQSRGDFRQRLQRSRSFSASASNGDAETVSVSGDHHERRKERTSTVRSRTPSARTRHSVLNQERLEKRSVTDSITTSSSLPSDHPPVLGESSSRLQRKLSLTTSNGAEIPPGFPIAAVNQKLTMSDMESVGHSSGPTILESTAKIRERQLKRAELSQLGESSRSLTLNDLRGLRRKKSLRAMAPDAPPPRSISVENDEKSRDGSERPTHSSLPALGHTPVPPKGSGEQVDLSLSARLDQIGAKSPSTRSRRKGSSQSVASAPAMSDKHRAKSPNVRKRVKNTSNKSEITEREKKKPETLPATTSTDDETDNLATFLGMPKSDDEDDHEAEGSVHSGCLNDMNSSAASLDPTILKTSKEPLKRINSIVELYHDNAEQKNDKEGVEGEIDLKDDSTQATQESSVDQSKRCRTPTMLSPSVVMFDSSQIQAAMFGGGRPIGPGSLSPHSSSLSGGSDSLRSPGVLKRRVGQAKAESPSLNKRVSWIELPLTNPGSLLVKSTDTDGTNERETTASADVVTSVDDLDEDKLADAMKTVNGLQNGKNGATLKKNPSLDAALENDKGKKKRHSADERTVGTIATATSEATMKTNNKSESPALVAKRKALKSSAKSPESAEIERPTMQRTTSSGSSRSSGSSIRPRGKDSPSDGSAGTLSRKSSVEEESPSKNKAKRKPSKTNSKNEANDSPKGSNKEGRRRSGSLGDANLLSPVSKTRSIKRSHSDPKNPSSSSPAGSKIKHIPKGGSGDSQSSGEPTTERSPAKDNGEAGDGDKLRRKKSYLNKRTMNKDNSLSAKSSVKSSLDKFLAKLDIKDEEADRRADDDHRSVSSEGGLKNRRKALRSRRSDSDDRSVSSAPGTSRRKTRRHSEKLQGAKKSATWWNLKGKEAQ